MIPNSSNSPFSAHQDVLEAIIPEEAGQKAALLEELKRRGKGAVGAKIWPDAVALYTKALEAADLNGEKAILKSNIALSQGKMGKWKESLQAAQDAVGLDASYVKGWWRLGQAHAAMRDPVPAVAALEQALVIEPGSKELQKELEKMRAMKPKVAAAKPTTTSASSATTGGSASSSSARKESLAKAESTSQSPDPMDVDESVDAAQFTKSDHVKGYKIVNGKKTSFFHNELSEEAAKLIGDIAPKKLAAQQPTAESTVQSTDGGSVWNKAGTWEEKDCTEWAKEKLSALLQASTGGEWKVSKATIGSGDASVARVRGNKRFIFGMENVVLEWDFRDGDATGKIRVSDFDGTDDEYEFMDFSIVSCDDDSLWSTLASPAQQTPLRNAIQNQIKEWVKLFHDTY